jgi:hypothetical protein
VACSVPKGSCALRPKQDERGPPKAITASKFFAAKIGRIPFQLSRKMLALLNSLLSYRIDLILNQEFEVINVKLVGNKVSDRIPKINLWPSDHAGVFAKLQTQNEW